MNTQEITALVKTVIAEELKVDLAKVVPEARIVQDLRADSLDTVEVIMSLEKAIGIEIQDSDILEISTVQHIIDLALRLYSRANRAKGTAS